MTLDGSQSQREEISWPKMGILKWPLTPSHLFLSTRTSYNVNLQRLRFDVLIKYYNTFETRDCTGFAGPVEKTYNEEKGRVRNYEREQISQKV